MRNKESMDTSQILKNLASAEDRPQTKYKQAKLENREDDSNGHLRKEVTEKVVKIQDLTLPRSQNEPGKVPQNQVMLPPMDESGDVDLNKLFSSEIGNESDVLKELFSSENVKVKTDLTPVQISIISRLELQASMTQNFYLSKVLRELETLMISKNRLSRGEFVQGFGGQKQADANTVFNKIGKVFSQDKV